MFDGAAIVKGLACAALINSFKAADSFVMFAIQGSKTSKQMRVPPSFAGWLADFLNECGDGKWDGNISQVDARLLVPVRFTGSSRKRGVLFENICNESRPPRQKATICVDNESGRALLPCMSNMQKPFITWSVALDDDLTEERRGSPLSLLSYL